MTEDLAIEYEVNHQDLVHFGLHHFRHSPTNKSVRWKGTFSVVLIGLISTIGLFLGTGEVVGIFVGAIATLAGVIAYPFFLGRSVRKYTDRAYREGENKGMTGWHRLTLQGNGIFEESEGGTQFTKFASVERVAESDDYIFIYISAVSAYAIPRNRVASGDLSLFLASLRERMESGPYN